MLLILSFLLATVLAAAAASVTVSYPLDDQLPPIARVNTPFSWTFSQNTFSSDLDLTYSASALPAWLSFDPSTRTLSGTPSPGDEGSPMIIIKASASGQSASSPLDLCVTHYPPPELHIPVESQFHSDNPSLSSVFIVSNSSSLHQGRPTLRIPSKWSFSIGFNYKTFAANNSLYYSASQADGSPLPDWVDFNAHAMTFNGYTPAPDSSDTPLPHTLSLALHASDQQGYSAASVPFDIVIANHDLAFGNASNSLPTINVTAAQPFELMLNSTADFAGLLLDGLPVAPDNVTELDIDISNLESWLRYDTNSRTLSGEPPTDFSDAVLPAVILSSVNQTLKTQVKLAAVSSFFSADNLDPILVTPGTPLTFYLRQFFSNSTDLGHSTDDIEISAAFDPSDAGSVLQFDPTKSLLTGTVPKDASYQHVSVTFTAYSHVTHSTSHTRLPISLSASDYAHEQNKHSGSGLSATARAKLLLGLKIGFGIVSAFIGTALVFAALRRCGHVPDSAVEGEEGRRAWTAEEMKWYGIGIEVNGERYTPSLKDSEFAAMRAASPSAPAAVSFPQPFGSALSRVLTRTASNVQARARSPLSPVGSATSPRMVRKVEFMGRVRATARVVSDKYKRVVSGQKRPVISKPTLILTSDDGGPPHPAGPRGFRPLDEVNASQYEPSGVTSLADSSPSSSAGAPSIPRRRADFARPTSVRVPPVAHVANADGDADDASITSSLRSTSSTRSTHEAVVQRATRATSVRSGASGFSVAVQGERPRLVPFTSATRVPVPKMPSSFFSPELGRGGTKVQVQTQTPEEGKTKRVVSQVAKVFRGQQRMSQMPEQAVASSDELAMGVEYVRALGDDGGSSLSVSNADRSPAISFSTTESSAHSGPPRTERVLARTGERFRFRVPVPPASLSGGGRLRGLEVRLTSGRMLPKFVRVEVDSKGVELSGVPAGGDVGSYEVGVYERGGDCVGRAVVEVVERKGA